MHSSNRIIQGLWICGELSIMEQLSIRSFLANGHEYHLYTYGDVKQIPSGTLVKDGNEILPAHQVFTHQSGWGQGSYAGFADLFRYHLLKQKGGWWVDTDVICLKAFDFSADYVIASTWEGEWGSPATNCVLKMPKQSKLAMFLSEESSQKDPNQLQFGEIGPHLVQAAITQFNLQDSVVSYETFCPISWRSVKQKIAHSEEPLSRQKIVRTAKDLVRSVLRPCRRSDKVTTDTYAIHLWNEIWRQEQLDKNGTYQRNCWYERLKAQYL